jgi:predicted Zn-dependent protease
MKQELKDSFSEARNLRDSGNLPGARNVLLDLSKRDPTSPAIFSVLGDVCWEMELREEAANAFRQATRLSPKLEAASLGLFHCLRELGRQEEALEEVKRFQSVSDSEDYRKIVKAINDAI